MKILLLSPKLNPAIPASAGGIATWTEWVLRSDFAKKHEVRLVDTALIAERAAGMHSRSLLQEYRRTRHIFSVLKKELRALQPDIVHLNTPCATLGIFRDALLCGFLRRRGKRFVLHFCCNIGDAVRHAPQRCALKSMVRGAACNIVLNRASGQYLERVTHTQSIYLPNFLPPALLHVQPHEVAARVRTVLYAGHVCSAKGSPLILEMAKRMPDKQFILAGHVDRELSEAAKSENVRFTGRLSHEDVWSLMREADVFVFPTHSEGFPNAVAEAMALGLPIVATPVGAIPDMVDEGVGGYILAQGDIEGFMGALTRLEDPEIRVAMSAYNQNKAHQTYSETQIMKKLEEIYQSCR